MIFVFFRPIHFHSAVFEVPEDPTVAKEFFSEIVVSVSDVKFSSSGRQLVSRDYMNLKVWDINMEREPLFTFPVHDFLRPRLPDLYESDYIFDKFECALSSDGRSVRANLCFMLTDLDWICFVSDDGTSSSPVCFVGCFFLLQQGGHRIVQRSIRHL